MTISNRPEYDALLNKLVRLGDDAANIRLDSREVYADAKSKGYDTKALRRVIRDMRKDPTKLREENDNYDVYAHAAGILPE